MRKAPVKKRVTRSLRPRSNVDPTRVALAALERIKTILIRSGYKDRIGEPLSMKELAAQGQLLGTELPPSYVTAMRVASKIGDPERFLESREMTRLGDAIAAEGGEEAKRYVPFCQASEHVVCFDRGGGRRLVSSIRHQGELPVVEWRDGTAHPTAAHFGEWLDAVADAREESIETAAQMPQRLKRLLYELGFRFEYPVVGRLETADAEAIHELIGVALARRIRGDVDRLFDASGKAGLTLNVDEFTLTVTLRTGAHVYEAEDVFRWLRTFRDENFFSDIVAPPSHPDQVRDLRRAPREPPLIERGVLHLGVLPAARLTFRSATGPSANELYLLARTGGASERAGSAVLRVADGVVQDAQTVEEPLQDVHVTEDGTLWGLTATHAVRITEARSQSFLLRRPTPGPAAWHGIGSAGARVLVWGVGALLEFDGREFVPFSPDAGLDVNESVPALRAQDGRLWMLVCGDGVGAVAGFDGARWQPIDDNQVIDANLVDLDVWRGAAYVLDRDGGAWKVDGNGPPRPIALLTYHDAFLTDSGTPRPLRAIRAVEGALLLASDGGVIVVGSGAPLFHAIPRGREPVRLVRAGGRAGRNDGERDTAIVAVSGPHAWIWRDGSFSVLDLQEW